MSGGFGLLARCDNRAALLAEDIALFAVGGTACGKRRADDRAAAVVAVRILRFHVDDKVHIGRLGGRLDLSDRKGGFFLIRVGEGDAAVVNDPALEFQSLELLCLNGNGIADHTAGNHLALAL